MNVCHGPINLAGEAGIERRVVRILDRTGIHHAANSRFVLLELGDSEARGVIVMVTGLTCPHEYISSSIAETNSASF